MEKTHLLVLMFAIAGLVISGYNLRLDLAGSASEPPLPPPPPPLPGVPPDEPAQPSQSPGAGTTDILPTPDYAAPSSAVPALLQLLAFILFVIILGYLYHRKAGAGKTKSETPLRCIICREITILKERCSACRGIACLAHAKSREGRIYCSDHF